MMAETPKIKNKTLKFILIGGTLIASICACLIVVTSLFPTETTPTPQPVAEIVEDTEVPTVITETPEEPTNTPEPTSTFTPEPTATWTSTATPVPDPIVLTGSGDDVVDFENYFDIAVVRIAGNAAGRHFAVANFGADGSRYELLVNTTEPYSGVRPLDFRANQHTTRFEITATGEWSIEILPITEARELEVPGVIDGVGDDVVRLSGTVPDIATIIGNEADRHFAVRGYHDRIDLLVNTTDPYSGRVSLNPNTVVLEITAVGEWTIEIEGR
jgi:hypothetical protein